MIGTLFEGLEKALVEAARAEGYEVGQAVGGPHQGDWYCNEWTNLSALARRIDFGLREEEITDG